MKGIRTAVAAGAALALTVTLSAQTPTAPAQDQTQPAYDAKKTVTVTGCLERSTDTATPTGTTGAAGTAAADRTKFVLNKVESSPAASGTAGTSGSATSSLASSYRLDAEDSKLEGHVGHKIQITGTVEDQAAAGTGTSATASASAAPKLKVDQVKMIAATCTP